MPRLLTDDEIATQLQGLENWQRADSDGDPAISTSFELADFRAALDLVQRIGDAAEQMDHHPDIDIRWNKVVLVLSTHSEGGLTQLDIEAAHRFNDEAGL
ncbi:MAG TPA: 4a-hydroxytetrahydrobiopterin dehydratase [Microlunatus sp.]